MSTISKVNLRLITLVLLMGSYGCALHSHQKASTVSQSDALNLAKLEFSKLYPERVGQYDIRIIEHSDLGFWSVWFEGRGKYMGPGGYVLINVNRTTGKIEVAPSD